MYYNSKARSGHAPDKKGDPPMKSLRRDEKLYIQAFREIRSYIILNDLKDGDLLPTEKTLCEKLGVSRNVLREAIKSMELMGMVRACPGRGTEVCGFSMDFVFQNVLFFRIGEDDPSVREMFAIRRILELNYAPLAFAALTEKDIAALEDCVRRLRRSYEETGFFGEEDREFHMLLVRPLNNSVLNSLLNAIWSVDVTFQLEQKKPHLSDSVVKHEKIVEALKRGDRKAFEEALQRHFSSGKYLEESGYREY